MDINFSFTVASMPTIVLHSIAAALMAYAAIELRGLKLLAMLVSMGLWVTTITVA